MIPKSVCLYRCFGGQDIADRLELSEGVLPAKEAWGSAYSFREGAMVPARSWRAPTAEELAALITEEHPEDINSAIGILKIPEEIMAEFRKLGVADAKNRTDFQALMRTPAGEAALAMFVSYARSLAKEATKLTAIPAYTPAGTPFTAFDVAIQRYVGLHIDSKDETPAFARQSATNRISLNLGAENRHLLFVNLDIAHLSEAIDRPGEVDPNALTAEFFNAYPAYPVAKLTIRPGEAYIAPTENVIHDAIGAQSRSDVQLTICGRIGIPRASTE